MCNNWYFYYDLVEWLCNLVLSLVSKMPNLMNLHNLAISLVLFGNSFITWRFWTAKRTRLWCNIAATTTEKVISDCFWMQSYSLSSPAEFHMKKMYTWFLSSFFVWVQKEIIMYLFWQFGIFYHFQCNYLLLGGFLLVAVVAISSRAHKPCILELNRKLWTEHLRASELQIAQVK